ncbi:MAG TPA: DUF4242 domain-containing protein [Candidatus Limnocylindria bacterium]|jgi:hypothetical protein
MPRYVVERTFPGGLAVPADERSKEVWRGVVARNADEAVTWIHSYVSDDHSRLLCIYEADDPDAIRRAAERNQLPVDRITLVTVLDPHAYR